MGPYTYAAVGMPVKIGARSKSQNRPGTPSGKVGKNPLARWYLWPESRTGTPLMIEVVASNVLRSLEDDSRHAVKSFYGWPIRLLKLPVFPILCNRRKLPSLE